MYKKMIVSWFFVILWASVIFIMSSMDTNESNYKSKHTISNITNKVLDVSNDLGLANKYPSNDKINLVTEKLNYPLRKIAHASEYFILTFLLIIALKNSRIDGLKIIVFALILCFLYACFDEYHQTFVYGRTGQFSDALIDTLGGIICCIIYSFVIKNKFLKKHV